MAIPVILDTDIGSDIDDTWALAMLMRCPELDLKMVLTETADTTYRAALTAKFLTVAGRDDVPIAIAPPPSLSRARCSRTIASGRNSSRG